MEKMDVNSILVVGDSLSKGVIFDSIKKRYCFAKDGFVSAMQKLLIPKIYNTAKFGATIAYGETLLVPKMRELEPEVVLIEFGGNDCDYDWAAIAREPEKEHQPKTPLGLFTERLREMVKKTGAKSTDLQSPETVDHLCDKCQPYAQNWAPAAEELWNESQAKKK